MTVIFADKARKEFLKLDKPIKKQIQTLKKTNQITKKFQKNME